MIGIKQFSNLEIEGLFSHFASAEQDDEFSTTQEQIFYELLENLPDRPKYIHWITAQLW
jgi:alanine racemase